MMYGTNPRDTMYGTNPRDMYDVWNKPKGVTRHGNLPVFIVLSARSHVTH